MTTATPTAPSTSVPRNVVICGAPRSGTSMLAEIFTAAGYHAGGDLIPPSPSNPHGFFEDVRVNRLNDDLMATLETSARIGRLPRRLWWMESFSGPIEPVDDERCGHLVPPTPFVMKDPRFVYTGPAWSSSWTNALVVVLVRPLGDVTRSLAAMAERDPDLFESAPVSGEPFDRHVTSMWRAMYRSALTWVPDDAVFVTEQRVRTGSALAGLSRLVRASLHGATVDGSLHRHDTDVGDPASIATISPGEAPTSGSDVTDRLVERMERDAHRLGVDDVTESG